MAYRRRRFGNPYKAPRAAVTRSDVVQAKRRTKCKGCGSPIEVGTTAVRLRLKKAYRVPCSGCGARLVGAKRYHVQCVPPDINVAMGFDPSKHVANAGASPLGSVHAVPTAHTVAPPPKPPTSSEAAQAALAALEHALVIKAKERGLTDEMRAAFKTYNGIKARVLRPGTPAEGEVATSIALQRIIKLIF